VTEGYSYSDKAAANVAFFPFYALLGAALHYGLGIPARMALVLIAHLALIGSLCLLIRYAELRFPAYGRRMGVLTAACVALFPISFFFRAVYSEPLFLFLIILTFWGLLRGWNWELVALIAGMASATRPVGFLLVVPIIMRAIPALLPSRWCIPRLAAIGLLSCSGLLGYMLFLQLKFGDPLVFVSTQQHWNHRAPPVTMGDQLKMLLTLQPIRDVYDPASPCYWGSESRIFGGWGNLSFWNPLLFLLAVAACLYGKARGWLNWSETVLALLLLLIPYWLQGYRFCMNSMGRFTLVAFPCYLVYARMLVRLPLWILIPVLLASGAVVTVGFVLFTLEYPFL